MLKENEGAMLGLGRRYENLFKSVVTSLERFYELLTQSKNIANQFIKHEKAEIAAILNECLRKVCLLYTSPSPRDQRGSRMPSSA